MKIENSILIATSIAPYSRLNIQDKAISSWIDHGFAVQSLNTINEINLLQPKFPNVEFIIQARTASLAIGKPMIYISDILHHFRSQNHKIVGIINSDIFLTNEFNLIEYFSIMAKNSLIYGPRTEVEDFNTSKGTLDPLGFDFFFFDRNFLNCWPETKFCLGLPFWDHWFPLIPLLLNLKVKCLKKEFALHIPHPTSRDDSFFAFNNIFASIVINLMETNSEFGKNFDTAAYQILTTNISDMDIENNTRKIEKNNVDKLAIFYDDLTKFVIKFLSSRSERVSLD